MNNDMKHKIVVFHGVDHKVGTTMLAQSAAELAAMARKDMKVLLMFLHGRSGTDYIKGSAGSVEQIKTDLDSDMITGEEIKSRCFINGNLFIMSGIGSFGTERHYFPETADHIIKAVKDAFDLIIVDSGNEIDCGIAVGALKQKAEMILVLTQQETIVSRYEAMADIYQRLGIEFSWMIINKYCSEDPYDLDYLCKRLAIDKTGFMPVAKAGYEREAEAEHRSLLQYRNDKYRSDIMKTMNRMMAGAGIEKMQTIKKGKKWISFT